MDAQSTSGAPAAGLFRRLAALLYDCLLLLALLFVGTLAALPLTGGEAITPAAQGLGAYLLYRAYLALLALGFFGVSWTHGGQTLGMVAWRIRLRVANDETPKWPATLRRFALGLALAVAAEFGLRLVLAPGSLARSMMGGLLLLPLFLNFAWIPFDARGRSLQDLACRMQVLKIDKSS
jgi:uncharacterized RDD family membrane protein YckC